METNGLIVKTPGVCGGRARLAGRRIPVRSIYRWYLSGRAPAEIATQYDRVSPAEIQAAISYAVSNAAEIQAEIAEEDRIEAAAAPRAHIAA